MLSAVKPFAWRLLIWQMSMKNFLPFCPHTSQWLLFQMSLLRAASLSPRQLKKVSAPVLQMALRRWVALLRMQLLITSGGGMRAISFAAIAQPAFLADSWKAAPKLFLLQPAQPAVLADSWIAAQSMAYPFLTFWITFSQRRGKRERCPACCFDPWVVSVSCGWASLSEAFFRESKWLFPWKTVFVSEVRTQLHAGPWNVRETDRIAFEGPDPVFENFPTQHWLEVRLGMRAISFAAIAQPAFLADSWKAAPKLFLLQPAQPAVLADSWIAAQSMAYPFLTFWITFSQRRGKRERCPACCFDPWVVSVSCGWASLSEAFFRESKPILFMLFDHGEFGLSKSPNCRTTQQNQTGNRMYTVFLVLNKIIKLDEHGLSKDFQMFWWLEEAHSIWDR